VQEVVKAFEAESAAVTSRSTRRHAKDLPLVDVDPLRVREVLTNLVSERVAPHADERTVSIRHHHDCDDAGDRRYRTAAAESPPRICRRSSIAFYKGRGSTGSGLGLTISKNLVEAHGGEIRAESTPAAARRFSVHVLPLRVR
jgi:two-component system sensor histidine kinase BaeS